MILLALTGKKRSGKNTVAKLIASMTPLRCKEFAFADDLKKEVAKMCGVSVSHIEQNKPLFRHLLQAWGVYQREVKGEHYWVAIELTKIQYSDCDVAMVTDCRFQNEYIAMTTCNARIIRVIGRPVDGDCHVSETEMDMFTPNFTIENTGSLDDLALKVRELLTKLNIQLK